MAGNENVIESLKLEIGVEVHGQDRLTAIQGTLEYFAETLESVNSRLREFVNLSHNIRSVRIPQMQVEQPVREQPVPDVPTVAPIETPTISIEPTQELSQSTAQLNDTIESTIQASRRATESLNKTSEAMKKAADAAKKSSKEIARSNAALKSAGGHATKAASGFGKLASSFLRIAKYRAIRAILRNITEGFQEGVQNLARYSDAFNSTMSQFA
ncbi:MAG: hypothetical protein J5662_01255, partial [Clostridia bacterium]|nr:hypothetical protein [Clostridia bacterium]